jgi:predicted dienelactone hydrolase
MLRSIGLVGAALLAAMLSACGSDSTTVTPAASTAHGTLAINPPFRIASVDAATFQAQLTAVSGGAQLLQISGNPVCGVDFYYLNFWTRGAVGEVTESSGALMVPTGPAPTCSGPRPIVLYAHGTQTNKAFNIADITNPSNTEGATVAAFFAAQGYIVVAPNYAGYDISTLGYHPFLNASQQSGEMIDALTAARTGLPNTFASATKDSGQLFISGYSEGGFVAMATQRAMQNAGMTVTAAAPMSGPYALEALFDTVLFGSVDLGSTQFSPLVTTSYQHAYNNVYTQTSDFYSATYATGIDTLLPSDTPVSTLISNGALPQLALFDSTTPVVTINGTESVVLTDALEPPSDLSNPFTPLFDLGFGNPYLINNSVRVSYALDAANDPDGIEIGTAALAATAPVYGLRLDLYTNDLRNTGWAPTAPTLMCGGSEDPTVFFAPDTGLMQQFWANVPTVSVLDVDPPGGASGPFAAIQTAFLTQKAQMLAFLESPAGGSLSPLLAEFTLLESYHGTYVPPFCTLGARTLFASFL